MGRVEEFGRKRRFPKGEIEVKDKR